MKAIQERYRGLLDELAEKFSALMEKHGYWSSDYTIWCTEFEAWSVDDMLYIVANEEKYCERYGGIEGFRDEVEAWINYNVDVYELGIQYINLKSWLLGCPRMSDEEIASLRICRQSLEDAMAEMQEKWGKRDDNPQPERLRLHKDK